jgi:hypothetical protein
VAGSRPVCVDDGIRDILEPPCETDEPVDDCDGVFMSCTIGQCSPGYGYVWIEVDKRSIAQDLEEVYRREVTYNPCVDSQ